MSTAPTPPTHRPQIDTASMAQDIIWGLTWSTCYQNTCKKKSTRNRTMSKKVQILREKWAKFQTKAQKSSKVYFMRAIWWSIWESGRSMPYLGELPYMFLVSGTWILDSIRWGDSAFLGLNSGFQSSAFLISREKLSWILDSRSKNFPTIEIQVTLHVHRAISS